MPRSYLSLTELGRITGLGRAGVSWHHHRAKERRVTSRTTSFDMPEADVVVGNHPGWDEERIALWVESTRHPDFPRRPRPGRPPKSA